MKKLLIGLSLLALSASASANDFFGGGNDGEWKMGPYGPYWEESDWPEWTPMYWMDEMMNSFDDEEDFGGGMPYPGMMGAPMGYGAAPMMAPPMGAPMMAPMGMPQMGAPMMAPPMGMPQMGAPMMAPMPMPAAPGATPGPAVQAAPAVAAPVPAN